jgi:hypothetical protein
MEQARIVVGLQKPWLILTRRMLVRIECNTKTLCNPLKFDRVLLQSTSHANDSPTFCNSFKTLFVATINHILS